MPSLEFGSLSLGLREAVIGLIAAVAIYMVVVVLRMRRLSRRRAQAAAASPAASAPPPAVAATLAPAVTEGPDTPPPEPEAPAGEFAATETLFAPTEVPAVNGPGPGLAAELAQLRDEVDAIRGELAALREDMHQELAHLRATQTVSPLYGDAMQMAVAGYDPAAIAERCGIARAEAELVVALAQSQSPER